MYLAQDRDQLWAFLNTVTKTVGFHKRRGISRPPERLLASKEDSVPRSLCYVSVSAL